MKRKENATICTARSSIGHCHCQLYDLGTTNETFKLTTEGQIKKNILFIFFRGALISGKELGPTSK
jgi:hypothetical protein